MRSDPFIYTDDPADYDGVRFLPTKWAICPTCHGDGKVRPTLSDIAVSEMDPEERQDYFAGHMDRHCDHCRGTGKIKVLDEARCDPKDLAEYRFQELQRYHAEQASEAERRMGA